MAPRRNGTSQLVHRLLSVALLLGCPRIGSAAGTWSVISLPQKPGKVLGATALTVDAAVNLSVAESDNSGGRIQKRDAQRNWSLVATSGGALGQLYGTHGLAVDASGHLYVAGTGSHRVQEYTPSP